MDTNSRQAPKSPQRTLSHSARLLVLDALHELQSAVLEMRRAARATDADPMQLLALVRCMQGGFADLAKQLEGQARPVAGAAPLPPEKPAAPVASPLPPSDPKNRCSGCGSELTAEDHAKILKRGPLVARVCRFCSPF